MCVCVRASMRACTRVCVCVRVCVCKCHQIGMALHFLLCAKEGGKIFASFVSIRTRVWMWSCVCVLLCARVCVGVYVTVVFGSEVSVFS